MASVHMMSSGFHTMSYNAITALFRRNALPPSSGWQLRAWKFMTALPQVTIMHQRNSLQILTPCYIQTGFNTNLPSTLVTSLTPRTLRSVHIRSCSFARSVLPISKHWQCWRWKRLAHSLPLENSKERGGAGSDGIAASGIACARIQRANAAWDNGLRLPGSKCMSTGPGKWWKC